MADWSLLPKDLLELINGRYSQTCFEIVHFRSVCSSWRSAIPRPSYRVGLYLKRLLPVFNHKPRFESHTPCLLKKIPVFLFRFQTPFGTDFLLIEVNKGESGEEMLMCPFQDQPWRYKDVITLNTLSSQIIPLGYYYKINFYAITTMRHRTRSENYTKRVAFLPLDGEDGNKAFAVMAGVLGDLMMYRSCDKGWTKFEGWFLDYRDVVSFKGKFYVVNWSGRGHVFVIEPSFKITEIRPVPLSHKTYDERLVVSGDELLLVQRFTIGSDREEYKHSWFRLFRLEEKEGQRRWVQVNDIEDRVVILGCDWSLCCSAKDLPGMKGNSVVFNDPKYRQEGIFVYELKAMKTSNAFTECRGYMFGENRQSLSSCGILTLQIQQPVLYDSSSESETESQCKCSNAVCLSCVQL